MKPGKSVPWRLCDPQQKVSEFGEGLSRHQSSKEKREYLFSHGRGRELLEHDRRNSYRCVRQGQSAQAMVERDLKVPSTRLLNRAWASELFPVSISSRRSVKKEGQRYPLWTTE